MRLHILLAIAAALFVSVGCQPGGAKTEPVTKGDPTIGIPAPKGTASEDAQKKDIPPIVKESPPSPGLAGTYKIYMTPAQRAEMKQALEKVKAELGAEKAGEVENRALESEKFTSLVIKPDGMPDGSKESFSGTYRVDGAKVTLSAVTVNGKPAGKKDKEPKTMSFDERAGTLTAEDEGTAIVFKKT